VGVLVNHCLFSGISRGRTAHEHLEWYEEAGKKFELQPIYFRLSDIQSAKGTVSALVLHQGKYRLRNFPLPKVIHNRAMYLRNPSANHFLDHLVRNHEIHLFNKRNRYSKWHTHRLMMEGSALRPHLPETCKASEQIVRTLGKKYEAVIVKPSNGSIGRGIMKVEQQLRGWNLSYPTRRKGQTVWQTAHIRGKFPVWFQRKMKINCYIAQQRLNLAKFRENPFDMRVSVQRNHSGMFQVTGIAAKVARRNGFVTNVAQGGQVFRLEHILQDFPNLHSEQVISDVQQFSLAAANHLSARLPQLADIGFDIGITPDGFPVFIEMNLRDLRYSFREGSMMNEWKQTYFNPIGYARYLLDQNKFVEK
jgi:hypothetical protein